MSTRLRSRKREPSPDISLFQQNTNGGIKKIKTTFIDVVAGGGSDGSGSRSSRYSNSDTSLYDEIESLSEQQQQHHHQQHHQQPHQPIIQQKKFQSISEHFTSSISPRVTTTKLGIEFPENKQQYINKIPTFISSQREQQHHRQPPHHHSIIQQQYNHHHQQQQQQQQQHGIDNNNIIKRPGIVIRLRLMNIITHTDFKRDWHPSLNYVIGNNGSGKSSIMTGLLLALGGKGSTLEKKSVKDCINYNVQPTHAEVEIELTHGGHLDPCRYGDTIIIKRIIELNGSSSYKYRTAEGKWDILRIQELDRILVTLQIMIDNPLQFLNQRRASNLLRTSDPKKFYTYFYRAMGLEACELLLHKTKADLQYAINMLKSRDENIKEQKRKVDCLKKEYNIICELKSMEERKYELQKEYIWIKVGQYEKEFKANRVILNKRLGEINECKNILIENKNKMIQLEKSFDAEKILLRSLTSTLKTLQEDINKKRIELESIRRTIRMINIQINDADSNIKKDTTNMGNINRKLIEIEQDREYNYEKRKNEIEIIRLGLNEGIGRIKVELTNASNKNNGVHAEVEQLVAAHKEQLNMINYAQVNIDEKRLELKNIDKVKRTQYDRFGKEMVALMGKIKTNEKYFNVRPRGPQGACYTVKDKYESYAPIIEYILYPTLVTFKVTNKHDEDLLWSLINSCYGKDKDKRGVRRPEIFHIRVNSSNEKIYDMRQKATHLNCPFPTLLDMLDIVDNDSSIINWLVDSKSIERILMFPSFVEGCNIMKDSNKVPSTCTVGYTRDFREIKPIPNYRVMVKNIRQRATFIQITSLTMTSNTKFLENEIQQLQCEHTQLKKDCEELKLKLNQRNKLYQIGLKSVNNLTNDLITNENKLTSLYTNYNTYPDIDNYKEEINYLQQSILKKQEEKLQLTTRLSVLHPSLETTSIEVKRLDDEMKEAQNQKILLDNRTSIIESNTLKREEEKYSLRLTTLEKDEKKLLQINKETENLLKKERIEAEKICERVDTTRDAISIKKEIEYIESCLIKNKAKLQQHNKYRVALEEAEKSLYEKSEENNLLNILVSWVTRMVKFRENHFHKKKLEYGLSLTVNFDSLISTRLYKGKLNVDHEDKTLTYYVCTDFLSEANAEKNFKQRDDGNFKIINKKGVKDFMGGLSGGERSFSTFCFMVSIWNIMEAPFYILDEFEVFMDAAYQAECHQIIRSHCRKQPEAQFFFFTPYRMESMPNLKEGSVLRLFPPVRQQQGEHVKLLQQQQQQQQHEDKKL